MNEIDWRERAAAYMQEQHVMSVATYGARGIWSAALFYVADQFTLYFLSAAHTRHATDFLEQSNVAVTIQDSRADWHVIKGIQLVGRVRLLVDDEAAVAQKKYLHRHPFLATAPEPLRKRLQKVNWYELLPEELYYIDNEQQFGFRVQII